MAGYIKFTGLTGSIELPGVEGYSQIQQFSNSVGSTGKGREDGQSDGQDTAARFREAHARSSSFTSVDVVKRFDRTSLKLTESVFQRDISGKPKIYSEVLVAFTTTQGDVFLKYTLKSVYIESYKIDVTSTNSTMAVERISLMFKSIAAEYMEFGTTSLTARSQSMLKDGVVSYQWEI